MIIKTAIFFRATTLHNGCTQYKIYGGVRLRKSKSVMQNLVRDTLRKYKMYESGGRI